MVILCLKQKEIDKITNIISKWNIGKIKKFTLYLEENSDSELVPWENE
jgi:hypothetical protein